MSLSLKWLPNNALVTDVYVAALRACFNAAQRGR
jgi:hypothetical protein